MEKHHFIHILTIKMNEIAKKDVTLHSKNQRTCPSLWADMHFLLRTKIYFALEKVKSEERKVKNENYNLYS